MKSNNVVVFPLLPTSQYSSRSDHCGHASCYTILNHLKQYDNDHDETLSFFLYGLWLFNSAGCRQARRLVRDELQTVRNDT